jgi:hypothetical protein
MINCLAKVYRIRVVGDRAENVETAIKHGMTAVRGMDEIPLLKSTTSLSTYIVPFLFGSALLLVVPLLTCCMALTALCRLIPSQRGAGVGGTLTPLP